MISYIEFMERVVMLNTKVKQFFLDNIRKNHYQTTSIELFLLMKLRNEPNLFKKSKTTLSSNGLFKHLKFILQSLEHKKIITITSDSNNSKEINITMNKIGLDILDQFSKITIPKNIEKSLEHLEIFSIKPGSITIS